MQTASRRSTNVVTVSGERVAACWWLACSGVGADSALARDQYLGIILQRVSQSLTQEGCGFPIDIHDCVRVCAEDRCRRCWADASLHASFYSLGLTHIRNDRKNLFCLENLANRHRNCQGGYL